MSIIDDAIRSAAEAYGIDPNLLRAQAWAESRNNPSAVSPAGAQGLMQIMPGTGKELGLKDPYDPWQSAYAGAKYLGQQLRRFDGDTDKALAAYNAGPGRVLQYGGVPPFKETQDYIKRINSRRELLNTIDGTLQIGSPSPAFIDNGEEPPRQFPQGEIPQPESSQQVPEYTPQWRSKIDQYGQATADKIGEALGAFDFRAQTERRNEFARKVADYYGGADDMGPADVPGAVLAAPVNLLRNALGPIRRALGNRQQASTDALSGPFGAQLVAAATGDPSVAETADETPGAGQVLKDLFTDARERRAQAVRASLQGLGAYDKLMERQGKALSQQLSGLDSLSQALGNNALTYGRMADAERGRFATNADIRRTDAMARSHYENAMLDRSRRMTQDVETKLAKIKAALIEKYGPVEAKAKFQESLAKIRATKALADQRSAKADSDLGERREGRLIGEELGDLNADLEAGVADPSFAAGRLRDMGVDEKYQIVEKPAEWNHPSTWFGAPRYQLVGKSVPEQPANKLVAAPTGNVGGAEGASSSQSPALDDAIKSGKIDLSQFATPKDLVAAMKADPATYTDDVVMHIRRQKNWD